MSNKQQTAVDFIDKRIEIHLNWLETKQMSFKEFYKEWDKIKVQAKELEKQQIESAYNDGYCDEGFLGDSNKSAEQYYKETYEQ